MTEVIFCTFGVLCPFSLIVECYHLWLCMLPSNNGMSLKNHCNIFLNRDNHLSYGLCNFIFKMELPLSIISFVLSYTLMLQPFSNLFIITFSPYYKNYLFLFKLIRPFSKFVSINFNPYNNQYQFLFKLLLSFSMIPFITFDMCTNQTSCDVIRTSDPDSHSVVSR